MDEVLAVNVKFYDNQNPGIWENEKENSKITCMGVSRLLLLDTLSFSIHILYEDYPALYHIRVTLQYSIAKT